MGERDTSQDIISITPKFAAVTHDTTTLGDDWIEAIAGLLSWEADFEALYNNEAAGIGLQVESVGGTINALSIIDGDADAIGDTGIVAGASVLTGRSQPMTVADMVKLSCNLKGNGRAGAHGKLLHILEQDTISENQASLDNTDSSANGGIGNLHVTAVTGTWTIKIQHSINDTDWVDLITFTAVAAAGGAISESKQVTGTVNRYLRVTSTEDVAGSITFAVTFARY